MTPVRPPPLTSAHVLQSAPKIDELDNHDKLSLEEVIKNTFQQSLGAAGTHGDKDSETAGWSFGLGNVAPQSQTQGKKKGRQKSKEMNRALGHFCAHIG